MKATCPNNPAHVTFVTVAHVAQDWLVDYEGHFLECLVGGEEVSHKPNPGNIWTCDTCGAEAAVTGN